MIVTDTQTNNGQNAVATALRVLVVLEAVVFDHLDVDLVGVVLLGGGCRSTGGDEQGQQAKQRGTADDVHRLLLKGSSHTLWSSAPVLGFETSER